MPRILPPPNADAGLLVLRVSLAVILLFHGVFKLQNGVGWIASPLGELGLPAFLAYGAYIAELVAPVMLIAGAWTRIAALIVAFQMVMAVVLVLRERIGEINPAGGGWAIELEAMIFFAAVTIAISGGGRYVLARDPV